MTYHLPPIPVPGSAYNREDPFFKREKRTEERRAVLRD
jgi:hypothetical protein